MQIRTPAVERALATHDFVDADEQRRACQACGLTVPKAHIQSTLMLQRVPVCAPEKGDDDDAN